MNLLSDSTNYRLGGRYIVYEDVIFLSYSASFIEFKFKGCKATARIMSNGYDDTDLFHGWVAVFVNGNDTPSKHFPVKKGSEEFVLYESDEALETTIRIMKYSETVFGDIGIQSIEIDGEVIKLPPSKKKLIEFVGDSITCGYGYYGVAEKDIFTTAHENPWDNYAGKLARDLDVDYQLISWSGNGVVSHYMDEPADTPRVENFFLQDLYPYADAEFERKMGINEYTLWGFDRKPELVVINLGTNDSSFARGDMEYTHADQRKSEMFAKEYKKLIQLIRDKNPDANILCILGVMIQCLTSTIDKLVGELRESGETKVFFKEIPLQCEEDGYATDGHPSPATHDKMYRLLKDYIEDNNLL